MNKIILLLLFLIFTTSARSINTNVVNESIDDQIDLSKMVPSDYFETFEEKYAQRNLQKSTLQPIRVTFDYKELDNQANGQITSSQKQYIKNIMEAAGVYLNKLIKVYPRTSPIKMLKGDTCYDMKVTKEIQQVGISDSDIHIYVTYINSSSAPYLANAIWCQLDPNPVVGRVRLNLSTMILDESNTYAFQDHFSTSLHEILHILGFTSNSINYWIDPDTGKPYGAENASKILKVVDRWENKNVNKVSTKNILKVARNHYGCPSIDGMYLENQGSSGSKGSHWERDLLGNEFMTASSIYGLFAISEFTAALLLDTGYYAEINYNMLMPIYWGKNRGCDFFNKSCNSGQFFPEFPDKNITESCDFFSLGVGSNINNDQFSQCKTITPQRNFYCDDVNSEKFSERLRQNTGIGSRCFRSNASIKGESEQDMSGRCFKAKCAADNQSVDVNIWGDEIVNCKYPNQVINLDKETKTTQGIMKCPPDFDLFCNFPRTCLNNCSNNGVCNNGYCVCLNGWGGEDCSKQCPLNNAWYESSCVSSCPSGLFKNFDNTCKPTCPYKQYKDAITNTCELCHVNCSVCSGPTAAQCTSCNNGYTLSGNQCVDVKCHESCNTCSGAESNQCTSCNAGKFLDSNKVCQPCKSPCSNCVNETQCTSCAEGFYMNDNTGQCTSNNTCHYYCATCSAWLDSTKCTSCRDGYMLSKDGQCLRCDKSCKTCTSTQQTCIECSKGYIYNSQTKSCSLDCDKSCSTCSKPQDSKSCIYCAYGKYFIGGQCLPCDSSCDLCKNSASFCTRCKFGYTLDSVQGICNPICKNGEFLQNNGSCKSCVSPCFNCQYYDNYCTSCVSGYELNKNSCQPIKQQCHITCNSCTKYNDEKACDSCKSGQYLSSGLCINCPIGCTTCSNANNCSSCQSGFQIQNGLCVENINIQCHSSCKTCSASPSGNQTFCTSCNDGQFLQSDYCLSCQQPCKTCSQVSNQCLSCDNDLYNYNPNTKSCDVKACHPSCKACTKPNDNFSCQSCQDGYFISGQSCLPCSQNCKTCSNNGNNCTSCANEFVLQNGTCQQKQTTKCDPSCLTCSKDNDPNKCLTCNSNQWLQISSDKIIQKCILCDQACKTCNSTYECTSCNGERYLASNNYCYPCQSNQKLENGKCVNKEQRQVYNTTCDLTCSSCIGTYYDQCTACTGNRVLQLKKSNLNYGYCVCPQGTTDVNQPMCQVASKLQNNIQSTTSTTFAASTATSTIVSASTSNPLAALGMMEFSQSVSYLSYVNKKTPVGFDDTMSAVSYSHTSNLFNLDSYAEQDAENEKQIMKNRNLESNQQVEIDEEDEEEIRNPKFSQYHKTKLFLINALALIIINTVVWTISGVLSLINVNEDKNSLFFKLRRIYNISIPIAVFTLSSQEFSLLMFLQMLNLKTITGLQILSTVFSFLTLIYIVGFTVFLFYCLEYKRVLSDSCENSQVWQQRFYLIYKFIKQDSFFTRNFVQITVLRKVLISFITACVVSSPIAQISLLLLCYTSYLIYLTICRPFKSNLYTVMMIILDTIIVLIHVLYCVMFAYEGDSEKEKVISLMMLFLTFSVFFAYLVYTLVIIGKICYNLFKKWQQRRQSLKSYVKRPQAELENPDMIEQQVVNMSQKSRNQSQNAIQSLNHIDDKGIVFSGEVLVKD